MPGLGTIANVLTVLVGSVVGVAFGHRIPEQWRVTLLHGLGLLTVTIGVSQGIQTRNAVFPVVAIVAGGLIGEAVRIEERLEGLGERLRRRLVPAEGHGHGHAHFVEGFVAASLLFCVGPLTILGSIRDGVAHDPQLLIVKAAMDGIVAVVFASTLGWGVACSAITIAVYQGALTALGGTADDALDPRMILELTATGGVMLLGIGVRLLDLKPIGVGSFLPALVIAPVAVALFAR